MSSGEVESIITTVVQQPLKLRYTSDELSLPALNTITLSHLSPALPQCLTPPPPHTLSLRRAPPPRTHSHYSGRLSRPGTPTTCTKMHGRFWDLQTDAPLSGKQRRTVLRSTSGCKRAGASRRQRAATTDSTPPYASLHIAPVRVGGQTTFAFIVRSRCLSHPSRSSLNAHVA